MRGLGADEALTTNLSTGDRVPAQQTAGALRPQVRQPGGKMFFCSESLGVKWGLSPTPPDLPSTGPARPSSGTQASLPPRAPETPTIDFVLTPCYPTTLTLLPRQLVGFRERTPCCKVRRGACRPAAAPRVLEGRFHSHLSCSQRTQCQARVVMSSKQQLSSNFPTSGRGLWAVEAEAGHLRLGSYLVRRLVPETDCLLDWAAYGVVSDRSF